jgi:2',5'-phosphodiesterase
MSTDSTLPIAARRAPEPLSPAPLVAASPRVQSPPTGLQRPVRPALAAILLFTIFRGGVPFLASSALPAALLRARAPAHARTRVAGAGIDMSSSNDTAGGSARGLPRAVVAMLPGEDKVNIAVPLAGKPRNLNRPGSEPLAKAMFRLRAAAAPPSKGKKKGGKGFVEKVGGEKEVAEAAEEELVDGAELVCELVCPKTGSTVDEGTLNVDAWQHGRVLRVGKEEFVVDLNPPSVSALRLPPRPLVGYPLRASFDLQFTTAEECVWKWYRGHVAQEGGEGSSPRAGGRKMVWEPIASDTGPHYVPQEQDVGTHLRVDCLPRGGDETYSSEGVAHAVADKSVERGPAIKAGQGRHDLTRHPLEGDGVRVVSYNLLASAYTDTTYAKTQLFPYVADGALDAHYRLQLIVEELLGFHADVLCLQVS